MPKLIYKEVQPNELMKDLMWYLGQDKPLFKCYVVQEPDGDTVGFQVSFMEMGVSDEFVEALRPS